MLSLFPYFFTYSFNSPAVHRESVYTSQMPNVAWPLYTVAVWS